MIDLGKISIIMPVFNGEKYLRKTLNSFLAQTYINWEAVCVDDTSTDKSLEILNEYAANDARIKVYTKPNGGWASKSIKFALERATGSYWRYSSQDDLMAPDLLEIDVKRLNETGADAVLPKLLWYMGEGEKSSFKYVGFMGDTSAIITNKQAFVASIGYKHVHGFALWKMEIVRKTGYYTYGFNSDSYSTRVLFLNCKKIAFSDGVFYYRQNNPNAITKHFSEMRFGMIDTNAKLRTLAAEWNCSEGEIKLIENQSLRDIINLQILLFLHSKEILPQNKIQHKNKIKSEWTFLHEKKNKKSHKLIDILFLSSFSLFLLSCKMLLLKRKISAKL